MQTWHTSHSYVAVAAAISVALPIAIPHCFASDDQVTSRAAQAQRAPPCAAHLEIKNTSLSIGASLEFIITVRNRSNAPVSLLNPFFKGGVPIATVDLVIIDENGIAVGEILSLARRSGSYHKLDESDFFMLPPDGIIGTRGVAALSIIRMQNEQIRRGKYRVQMIFRDWFVSEYPYSGLPLRPWDPAARNDPQYIERTKRWEEDYSGKEIFRSNAVEIEVVPAK
jgi:hypothetical protein